MQRGLESRDHLFVVLAQDREPGASEAFSSVVHCCGNFAGERSSTHILYLLTLDALLMPY
jgi:hypothetical protein